MRTIGLQSAGPDCPVLSHRRVMSMGADLRASSLRRSPGLLLLGLLLLLLPAVVARVSGENRSKARGGGERGREPPGGGAESLNAGDTGCALLSTC